jgi:hypothetical protein
MFVVYAGMPKSGSAYLSHLLNDACAASGRASGRDVKHRFHLEDVMLDDENRVEVPAGRILVRLWAASVRSGPFVVKTHAGPTPWLRRFVRAGLVRVVYSIRDPRDVLLSTLEHGRAERVQGRPGFFRQIETFEDAARFLRQWIRNAEDHSELPRAIRVSYESLVANPLSTLEGVLRELRWPVADATLERILQRYAPQNLTASLAEVLHFNKGTIGRFRTELTPAQRAQLEKEFGPAMERMGYPATP